MYKSINVDAAVKHIKNIVDSNRCAVCDRTSGTRLRYVCGHTSCEDCVVLAADCSVCLTPPQSVSREPVVDKPFTQRVADALHLLNVFQNEFHIDVYRRHRLSEQLKVEKELFPDCIQAPVKYFNKRKTFKNTKLDKENRLSQLPGEEVSLIENHKMENQSENVEMWLNKYVRKPFGELNSNDEILRKNTQAIKKQHNTSNNENSHIKRSKKRSLSKTALSTIKNKTPAKKTKIYDKESESRIEKVCGNLDTSTYFNTDKNESGIVMDDEAIILEKCTKVPFYLKGYFSDKCIDCNGSNHDLSESVLESNNNKSGTYKQSTEDVSITVENKSFITIINIKQSGQKTNKANSMRSVEIQTDTREIFTGNENVDNIIFQESPSQDLFQDGKLEHVDKVNDMKSLNKTQHVIIDESDSDEDVEASMSLEVTAEIHRSCEEVDYGILADVDNLEEHSKRARRAPRGITPTSSNSSEKENYNPNKTKKAPTSKKKPMKK